MTSLDHLLCATDSEDRVTRFDDPRSSTYHHAPLAYDKPNPRRCSIENCQKTAKRGGRCIAHGGGNKCAVDGCTTSVVSRGLCVAHGGGKRCQTEACAKSAQSGGFCWVHGGGKKCGYKGCPKRAQSGGACIAHGGGKRCRMDGCNKVVQYDGLCVGHGGYRRCVFESCDQRAMANDYCQQHGGSSVCVLELCYKRAVRGGMCSKHKTEASLQAITASGLSTPDQLSDEDRRRRAARLNTVAAIATRAVIDPTPTSEWRSRMNLHKPTGQSAPEHHVPASRTTGNVLTNNDATRSPSPVRSVARGGRRDSPVAPGLTALLNANDKFPSFTTYNKTRAPTDRYARHPHTQHSRHLNHERKVYPVLPGIHALQNYRSKTSSSEGQVWCESPLRTAKTVGPELRIVVTEADRLESISSASLTMKNETTRTRLGKSTPTPITTRVQRLAPLLQPVDLAGVDDTRKH